MSCYLCYLNGSPWAPRNWLWRQCGLRVHRINGGSWRGASLNHIYGLPMESDYGTSANLSISRAGPSLSEKLHLPWATQTQKSEQAWGVPSTQSLGGTQRTSLGRVGSVYQCHSHGTRALRNPMMEKIQDMEVNPGDDIQGSAVVRNTHLDNPRVRHSTHEQPIPLPHHATEHPFAT